MSYASVPAYHVYKAAEIRIEELKAATNARIAQMAVPNGWMPSWWGVNRRNKMLHELNMVDARAGTEVAKLMMLSCAATSAGMQAMMALDEEGLALLQPCFFDQRLMREVRQHMAFAATPGGNA